MNPALFQSLNEHVQQWAARTKTPAVDVAGALVEMAAQNCVQYGITKRGWRDQCAEAFARATRFVKRDNPALRS